jgi:hypothetical protein
MKIILMTNQLKFNFLKLFFIFLIGMSLTACRTTQKLEQSKDFPAWMQGEWVSYGFQLNTLTSWSIYLKVNQTSADIKYPSLECGGNWTIEKQEQNAITLIETITEGTDKCTNKGKIIITKVDADHISFSYFSPFNNRIEAFSTLIKKDLVDSWDN